MKIKTIFENMFLFLEQLALKKLFRIFMYFDNHNLNNYDIPITDCINKVVTVIKKKSLFLMETRAWQLYIDNYEMLFLK